MAAHGVFECKLTANMDVLGQALRWVGRSHYVSICTPYAKVSTSKENFIMDWLRPKGIGWHVLSLDSIENVAQENKWRNEKQQQEALRHAYRPRGIEPKLNRHAHKNAVKLRNSLSPHMNNYVAGSGGSEYSTPYKRVMADAEIWINRFPGEELGILVSRIKHHYSSPTSAANSIRKHIEGLRETYRIEGSGKTAKIYPVEVSPCR